MFGRLRASDRALAKPSYYDFGLPWHSFLKKDARPLEPRKATELQFALLPMSYIFPAGHRIRLTLAFSSPSGGPGEPVTVLTGPEALSSLTLLALEFLHDLSSLLHQAAARLGEGEAMGAPIDRLSVYEVAARESSSERSHVCTDDIEQPPDIVLRDARDR